MQSLTQELLDRISSLALAGVNQTGKSFLAAELSPYMEWYWLQSSGNNLGSLRKTGPFVAFHERLSATAEIWTTREQPARGLLRVRRRHSDSQHIRWVEFRYELQRAAVAAGFGGTWAKQIVGAIGELEDNIHWHSESPRTGILAYWLEGSILECVVLDTGVGVLQSLRRSEEYRDLSDHGSALRLATQNGTSRYGAGSGRGWGFNELFVGLANSNASIRFRSGDHLLTVDGRSGLLGAQLHQRAAANGLLVTMKVSRVRG